MTSQLTNPTLSVITPTLNSEKVLLDCLNSLKDQEFKDFEIIISDGGSKDKTLNIAKKFNSKIVNNKLKTAEAGKAKALKEAKGKFILLLDSDNILPDKKWLSKMLKPLLTNPKIVGSEPYQFTYRKSGGFIERYCALFGANDPYAWFTNNIDKINYLNNLWPFPKLVSRDTDDYLVLNLTKQNQIPTIGANGTIFTKAFLDKYQTGNYLFDIDLIFEAVNKQSIQFSKVKTGIIHTYCESSIQKFIRKQQRRVADYYHFLPHRRANWGNINPAKNLLFILYSYSLVLPLITSLEGFYRQRDIAWFFHPLACFLTANIYLGGSLRHKLKINSVVSRESWKQ